MDSRKKNIIDLLKAGVMRNPEHCAHVCARLPYHNCVCVIRHRLSLTPEAGSL